MLDQNLRTSRAIVAARFRTYSGGLGLISKKCNAGSTTIEI